MFHKECIYFLVFWKETTVLQTINGFDLLLIIIITLAGFKIYNLNRECESYVRQIMQISWELQQEIQASKHERNDSYCACESCIPF
jgi:hypothetical protein